MNLLKPSRIEDKEYLEYIRKTPCLVCRHDAESHHLITRGAFGSDYTAIPLCRRCHSHWHNLGNTIFEVRYKINTWKEAHRLLERWMLINSQRTANNGG